MSPLDTYALRSFGAEEGCSWLFVAPLSRVSRAIVEKIVASTQMIRTRVEPQPRYFARPPQTPASQRSSRER